MENFKTLKIENVVEMFNADSQARKGNKSSNDIIIKLCGLVDSKSVVSCELTKGGNILNRGSVAECIIKLWFKGQHSAKKYGAGKSDLVADGVKYEIKLSTAKGYATYNPKQNYANLIFINSQGIWQTNGTLENSLILDKCGQHIKDISKRYAKLLYKF